MLSLEVGSLYSVTNRTPSNAQVVLFPISDVAYAKYVEEILAIYLGPCETDRWRHLMHTQEYGICEVLIAYAYEKVKAK